MILHGGVCRERLQVETLALTHAVGGRWTARADKTGLALALGSVALPVAAIDPAGRAGTPRPLRLEGVSDVQISELDCASHGADDLIGDKNLAPPPSRTTLAHVP